jgi:hypothetical protein
LDGRKGAGAALTVAAASGAMAVIAP